MKAPFSPYLNEISDGIRSLIGCLSKDYEYVSIHAADSFGLNIRISAHAKSVSDRTLTSERGFAVRVMKDGLYSEYSFNQFDPGHVEETYRQIKEALDAQLFMLKQCGTEIFETPAIPEEETVFSGEKETEQLPETADTQSIISFFKELCEKGMAMSEHLIDCTITGQSTHISKLFMSTKKDLRQSYVYSEATIIPVASKDGRNTYAYEGVSGLCGPELFEKLEEHLPAAVKTAEEMLGAERMEPGEYEIITSPEVSGLIAHEAFGHGVEMDMFVKNRALGKEYIGKRVGSELVTMHEGALCADNTSSYFFDDEGVMAGDVTEINHGILETGICDTLSALRLGTKPTGNGKRQNFEHKAYTRMTNTLFDSGNDRLEDMIASVSYGWLLEGMESGMEDPKHWGIQCIISCGREIKDGKLTGRIAAPIIMTGYVPDLLSNISMVSSDRGVFGNGYCGKGYKEFVKTADGGPYLKTKARLG